MSKWPAQTRHLCLQLSVIADFSLTSLYHFLTNGMMWLGRDAVWIVRYDADSTRKIWLRWRVSHSECSSVVDELDQRVVIVLSTEWVSVRICGRCLKVFILCSCESQALVSNNEDQRLKDLEDLDILPDVNDFTAQGDFF